MRKWLAALVLLCVAALLCWIVLSPRPSAHPPEPAAVAENQPHQVTLAPSPQTTASNSPAIVTSNPLPGISAAPPIPFAPDAARPAPSFDPSLLASRSSAPALPPETVLQNVRNSVRQYGSMFSGNPVGTNEEITRALNGDNPKQARFLSAEAGMRVNAKGELIDSWGTPLFFHQLSATDMEIRSAGPDRTMWTSDDLITR